MSNCRFKKQVLKSLPQYEMEVQMVLIYRFLTKDITNALVAKICLLQCIAQRKIKCMWQECDVDT